MVSVIIPTYNRAEYISETIASVHNQDYAGKIEIIVIDDGSTDGTAVLLEELQATIPSLKVIRTKNSGVSSARNKGMSEVKGDFIQFLDSDDLIAPTKFSKQIKLLEENKTCGLCYCIIASFEKDPSQTIKIFPGSDILHTEILPAFLTSVQWQTSAPLYRRSACEEIGDWNQDLSCWEDWEYGCRAGLAGIKPVFCNETFVFLREHDGERLSQGALESTASALETATKSIISNMQKEGHSVNNWFDIMARHLLSAGRAFALVGNEDAAKRSLNEAKSTAKSKKLKMGLFAYMMISNIFGYKKIVDFSKKVLGRDTEHKSS